MKKISKKIIATTVLGTMLIYTMPIMAFANEETIYSKLDSRGNSYKTIATTIKLCFVASGKHLFH